MTTIWYLVSEPDVFTDLERANNDVIWSIVFDNLSDAEIFAVKQSHEHTVGIHKFIDDKWESMLSMVWDEDIYDMRNGEQQS
jgi:hypothetical protein